MAFLQKLVDEQHGLRLSKTTRTIQGGPIDDRLVVDAALRQSLAPMLERVDPHVRLDEPLAVARRAASTIGWDVDCRGT